MVSIRSCLPEDVFALQDCNTMNLPENYQMKYYFYHYLLWPQLLYIAETDTLNTAGYVLAKMNEEGEPETHGHITSLAVSRTYRKLGLARHLMNATHQSMQTTFSAEYSSLHVRVSNRAAYSLYCLLGYKKQKVEKMYYSDKEDAFSLHRMFPYGIEKLQLANKSKQRKHLDFLHPQPSSEKPVSQVTDKGNAELSRDHQASETKKKDLVATKENALDTPLKNSKGIKNSAKSSRL